MLITLIVGFFLLYVLGVFGFLFLMTFGDEIEVKDILLAFAWPILFLILLYVSIKESVFE